MATIEAFLIGVEFVADRLKPPRTGQRRICLREIIRLWNGVALGNHWNRISNALAEHLHLMQLNRKKNDINLCLDCGEKETRRQQKLGRRARCG